MDDQLAQASGCQLRRKIASDDFCDIHAAVDADAGREVRLTVFSSSAFANDKLREAYKTDRERLVNLRHPAMARFLRDGEYDDRLFYLQDAADWPSLRETDLRATLTTDDIVEIGWQVCSALQQTHNVGLCHSGISDDSILLSEDLRVLLCDFRLVSWREAYSAHTQTSEADGRDSDNVMPVSIAQSTAQDLLDLIDVLKQLALESTSLRLDDAQQANGPQDSSAADPSRHTALQHLLNSLGNISVEDWRYTARDVQGLLGEILIGDAQDAMAVVDRRTAGSHFRSSIVEELFDDADVERESPSSQTAPKPGPLLPILPIIVGALLAVILLWAAGFLG
jgi:serine/threonine protein kinase